MGRHKLNPFDRRVRIDVTLHPSVINRIDDEVKRTKKSRSRLIEEMWGGR